MSNEEKKQHIAEVLSNITSDVIVHDVMGVNHSPHPFMIGPEHVSHASDNHSGILDDATLKAIPCAHKGCNLSYVEHTSDKVCFLKLAADVTKEDLNSHLQQLVEELGDGFLTGFGFIKTEFEIK